MSARRIPVDVAVHAIRTALPIARTWRFRHPDDPATPHRPRLGPRIYACWHEHLLPISCLFAGQGVTTLASRDRDGEIITRLLERLGYSTARGSSTRGGQTGFRQLLRAAASGQPIILTGDGPRGPRRSMKEGTPRLAAHTGRSVVPVGLASSAGWRLDSWDRFLIPAPGATVFVSLGSARVGPGATSSALELGLGRETERCEQAAQESRWSRPPRIRRALRESDSDTAASRPGAAFPPGTAPMEPRTASQTDADAGPTGISSTPDPLAAGELPAERVRRRSGRAIETRVRATWTKSRPHPLLRAPAAALTALVGVRGRLYDVGVLATHSAGLPVISVGGVTVGGSGKTPFVSYLADRLADAGHQVAILTRGYPDELALHGRAVPRAAVWGHPDRMRLAGRAASEGATVAVLDDGFQHRRLRRDLDVLLLDRDALHRTHEAGLPAGPFRERWRHAVRRADVVVLTGREPWDEEIRRVDERLRSEVASRSPDARLASLAFASASPRPANGAASAWVGPAEPVLALTGIMKPNLFFDRAAAGCPSIAVELAVPDHGLPTRQDRARLDSMAGEGGVVMTEKDLGRLGRLFAAEVPIWVLPERIVWKTGEAEVHAAVLAAATGGVNAAAGAGA